MSKRMEVEAFIASAAPRDSDSQPAPARLKSRMYSHLVQEQASGGPLLSLSGCKANGARLCVFEELVRIIPVAEAAQSANYCRICHARVLAEHLEHAPIFWPNCPYVKFQNR